MPLFYLKNSQLAYESSLGFECSAFRTDSFRWQILIWFCSLSFHFLHFTFNSIHSKLVIPFQSFLFLELVSKLLLHFFILAFEALAIFKLARFASADIYLSDEQHACSIQLMRIDKSLHQIR